MVLDRHWRASTHKGWIPGAVWLPSSGSCYSWSPPELPGWSVAQVVEHLPRIACLPALCHLWPRYWSLGQLTARLTGN
jgi:hypothetical protein